VTADDSHSQAIIAAVLFAAFSAVHLIDNSLFGVPLEFNLSVPFALTLGFAYMVALVGLIAAAAIRCRAAYLGIAIAGALILLAQVLKSLPEMLEPGHWHSGLASELAAIGLAICAASAAVASTNMMRGGVPIEKAERRRIASYYLSSRAQQLADADPAGGGKCSCLLPAGMS